MNVTVQTFALLPAGHSWAAYLLALARDDGGLDVKFDPARPEAVCVLQAMRGRIEFEVSGDDLMSAGIWELSPGPSGHSLPEMFDPTTSWTMGDNQGYWALVARWADTPERAELYSVWTRDEFEHTRLGLLDNILEDLLFAANKPDDEERRVEFDETFARSIEALVRDAGSLRAASRVQRSIELQAIEGRVERGDSSPDLPALWEDAQAACDQLGFVAWERLLDRA
jgi:hypothetical protein